MKFLTRQLAGKKFQQLWQASIKMFKIINFLKEVRLEFRHVNWLSKKQVVQYTLIVIGLSLGVSVFLGFFDFVFNYLFVKFVI